MRLLTGRGNVDTRWVRNEFRSGIKTSSHCCDFCFLVIKIIYVHCQKTKIKRKRKQLVIGVIFGCERFPLGKRWRGTHCLWPGIPGGGVSPAW